MVRSTRQQVRCLLGIHEKTTDSFGVTGAPVQQHPVAGQEVLQAVPDWESQPPDVDGVHQAEALELVRAQVPVEHLEENTSLFRSEQCPTLAAGPSG